MVKCVVASPIEDLRYCLLQAHVVLDGLGAADSARNLNRPAFGSLRGQKAASLNHAHERRGVDFGGLERRLIEDGGPERGGDDRLVRVFAGAFLLRRLGTAQRHGHEQNAHQSRQLARAGCHAHFFE